MYRLLKVKTIHPEFIAQKLKGNVALKAFFIFLTEVFIIFVSCKAKSRQYDAKLLAHLLHSTDVG